LPKIGFSQEPDLEFSLDVTSGTIPLPKVFKPYIDLSGRGFHENVTWPKTLAAKEVLDIWQKDIGFNGLYRLQYNLWEISQLEKDKEAQDKLLANYENIIKNINASGGIVILNLFGTPAGLGKALDKKSPPSDLKAYKELIKTTIKDLSCHKRYNIWYEVWNAPDLEGFFLGRKQEYFNLYRQVAESIKELRQETKMHIPVGGPSVSWWFQNIDGNTILTPERSLIYELLKFCYHYRLPIDFISWHTYSTNPSAEKENTLYKKTTVKLIRDWLTYFKFDRNTPLIIDEWNFDRDANVLSERKEESFICASFIPSRVKNMYEGGIDYQLYFSLEDFQNNKEGVNRNVGIFLEDKAKPKSIYNAFRFLVNLEPELFTQKTKDEFSGIISTKGQDKFAILIYNYIDPEIAISHLSNNIGTLSANERKILLDIIKSKRLEKILSGEQEISNLRTTKRVKALLTQAQELNKKAKKFMKDSRNINIGIKNLKGDYLYDRYVIDSSCSLNCELVPVEKKEISGTQPYQEVLSVTPYSVQMILLKQKPKEPETTATLTNEP
jgi:hypothetical protein